MAMYWPQQKVVLDIVDDPLAQHVDERELDGWNIMRVTLEELHSLEGMRRIGDELCIALGQEPPEKTPEWLAANERLFNALNGTIPGLQGYPYCVANK